MDFPLETRSPKPRKDRCGKKTKNQEREKKKKKKRGRIVSYESTGDLALRRNTDYQVHVEHDSDTLHPVVLELNLVGGEGSGVLAQLKERSGWRWGDYEGGGKGGGGGGVWIRWVDSRFSLMES